jgi:hypothetical protein
MHCRRSAEVLGGLVASFDGINRVKRKLMDAEGTRRVRGVAVAWLLYVTKEIAEEKVHSSLRWKVLVEMIGLKRYGE